MSFYGKMAKTANRLIKKFGAAITISRVSGESVDPVTGVVTPGTEELFYPFGILKKYPDNLIDGTSIKSSDRVLILDNTVEPLMTDTIVDWSIESIETSNPAGTSLVYFVQVRK